ncbi:DUF885 domain-containing protein [Lachnospiraceae bacterium]|nr:DUF885 domain-containing protein [Lachnospiraceae bacterium]
MKKHFLKRSAVLLSIILCIETGCAGNTGNGQTQQAFTEYTDQIFRTEVAANTLNMHYTLAHPENYGITDYTVTYGDISQNSELETSILLENWKKKLGDFEKKELTVSQQMTYDIMIDYIEHELKASGTEDCEEILRPSTGFQSQLPVLLAEYTFYDEQDIEDYLKLISCTPDFFRQIIEEEKRKSQQGLFMADFAVEDIVNQCNNFTQDPQNNYLLSTFDSRIGEMSDKLSKEQAAAYIARNRQLVLERLIPAYQNMAQEMAALKGTGKNSGGLCGLPGGKEYYRYLVRNVTGSDLSVEEMQKQTEKKRDQDMKDLTKLAAENADISEMCSNYQLPTEEPELILEDLQEKMKKDFPAAPDVGYTVKSVHPSLEEYTAPAFYLTPPIDDISQNCIYINQSKGDEKLKLYTTIAHEGFPGHLYQNVMERSSGLSAVRSLFGSSGYAEGWATYVEMQSFYYADVDPRVAAYMQKNQSALLSLYATADMGIHYHGWTLRDTVDFFGGYQITNKQVIKEIYQLIIEEPAHYLKYYIGYLEFLNLRKYAEKKYGDGFSNYKFHESLMKMGPAPFSILKKYLPQYWEN